MSNSSSKAALGGEIGLRPPELLLAACMLCGCAASPVTTDTISMEVVRQPDMIATCPPRKVVHVRFIEHLNLKALADAYEYACQEVGGPECAINADRLRKNGLRTLAFHVNRPEGIDEIHFIPPKDFNDWEALAQLGHEAFHLCGARHSTMSIDEGR
jgi:hypothetical protein